MMPRRGSTFPIDVEVISKPKSEYRTDEYFELDLPVAPAVMVGDEIVVEGAGLDEAALAAVIRRHLGLPEPEPPQRGRLARLFRR